MGGGVARSKNCMVGPARTSGAALFDCTPGVALLAGLPCSLLAGATRHVPCSLLAGARARQIGATCAWDVTLACTSDVEEVLLPGNMALPP